MFCNKKSFKGMGFGATLPQVRDVGSLANLNRVSFILALLKYIVPIYSSLSFIEVELFDVVIKNKK